MVDEQGPETMAPETATDPAERLAAMRRSYTLAGLSEQDLAPTWLAQFRRWFDDVYDVGATVEPNAMVVSTATGDGVPSSRTVLCKGVDERGFVFYTNYRSRKGCELADNPRVGLLFPWYAIERQVIVGGTARRIDASESDDYFASRPYGSRLGAWASQQSEPVESRAVLEAANRATEKRFPVEVPRPEHWGGLVVEPESVEFWQGRQDRLHDRLRFRRNESGWLVERLSP